MSGSFVTALGLSLVLAAPAASPKAATESETTTAKPEGPKRPRPGWQVGCSQRALSYRSSCTRSSRARAWFAVSGVLAAGTGAALSLLVGDALHAGDPGAMMFSMGVVAVGGAALGAISGLHHGDRPAPPDRIRPNTIGVDYSAGGEPILGETAPGTANLRIGPTYYFPNGDGRLRLLGRVGSMLGPRNDVDPRSEGGESFQTGLSERSWAMDWALDLAVALPYPVRPQARERALSGIPHRGYLGAWELRYKPSLSMRRERYQPAGEFEERKIERLMLLPLTVGARSHLSPRQRFTFYAGPRIDFISYAVGDGALQRSPASVGSFYGEAWWDMDFPHLLRGEVATRYTLRGQLSAGYIHTRFDGQGANLGAAIGFMGPYNFAWRMRLHRLSRPHAWQFGLGAWVGNGVGGMLELGVSLPDFGARPQGEGS